MCDYMNKKYECLGYGYLNQMGDHPSVNNTMTIPCPKCNLEEFLREIKFTVTDKDNLSPNYIPVQHQGDLINKALSLVKALHPKKLSMITHILGGASGELNL